MCRRPCPAVPACCAALQAHSEIPTGALATGLWLQGGRTGHTNEGQGGKTAQMGLHHQTGWLLGTEEGAAPSLWGRTSQTRSSRPSTAWQVGMLQ